MSDPKTHGAAKAALAAQGEQQRKNLQKPISVGSRRIALERKITLDFPHFQGFLTEYSSNLSMTGMFVKSSRPEVPGTVVAFEFRLADGLNLIRGQAEVVWRRLEYEGEDRPAGMGMRFVRLDKESRRLIRWAVEKRLHDGAESFELDELPDGVSLEETSSIEELDIVHPGSEEEARRSKLYPYAGAAVARSGLERWRPLLLGVAALLAAAGLLYYFQGRGVVPPTARPPGGAPAVAEAVPPVPEAEPLVPGAAPPVAEAASLVAEPAPPPEAVSPVPEPGQDLAEVLAAVEAWGRAWSQQRADEYLAFYAADFRPPGGMSRADWRAQRRVRISRPSRIEVRITDLGAERLGPESVRVSFLQLYVSDSYRDTTRKTLQLIVEDGRWKISEERSEP